MYFDGSRIGSKDPKKVLSRILSKKRKTTKKWYKKYTNTHYQSYTNTFTLHK